MSGRTRRVGAWVLLCLLACNVTYADDDPGLQTYLSANGLLQRGLYDLAAQEYETFLAENEEHEKADRARYGLAVCRFRTGDYPATLVALKSLPIDGDFAFAPEVAALRGQAQLATGAHKDAIGTCANFLKKHARHKLAENVTAILAEACLQVGRYDDVRKLAERFAKRWSKSPLLERIWFFEGSANLAESDWTGAAAAFNKLLSSYPDSVYRPQALLLSGHCAEQQSKPERAVRRYEELLSGQACSEQGDALLALAGIARQRNEPKAALQRVADLLKQHPEHPRRDEARLLRASVLLDQDKTDQAGRDLAAIQDQTLADRVAYWQAKTTLRSGAAERAADQFEDAMRQYPDSQLVVEMAYDRCVALLAAERDDRAREALESFCERYADHPLASDALLSLTQLLQRSGDLAAADQRNEQFLKQYGDHPEAALAALLQADNAYQQDELEAALRGYRSFLKRFKKSDLRAQAELRLGLTLYRLERYDEALPILQSVVQESVTPQALLALSEIHFAQGKWAPTIQHLERYLELDAADELRAPALLKLGLARQRMGDHNAALQSYERLLNDAPQSDAARQARFERGQVLAALGQNDQAQEAFEETLRNGGDQRLDGFARRHLAQLAANNGQHERVIEIAADLLRNDDPKLRAEGHLLAGQAELLREQPAKAEEHLRAFLQAEVEVPEEQRAAAQLQLAQALSRQDKFAEAQAVLKRWSKLDSDPTTRAAGMYELAWTQRQLGDQDAASKSFSRLLDLDAGSELRARALVELAELHALKKNCDEAVKLLKQVVQLEAAPDVQAAAMYRLGVCAFEGEAYDQAAQHLTRFIERFPEHPLEASVRYFCAEALVRTDRHQQALPHLRRVVETFRSHEVYGPCLVRLGDCLVARQQWAAAGDAFAKYVGQFADGPLWHEAQFGSGWTAENQGRYADAIKAYRVVVSRHKGPTAARAQFQIGECLFAEKKYEEAVRELLRVEILYAYPEWSAAALYEAGRCFEELGRSVEARQQFQACCERYEKTRWAELARGRLAAVSEGMLPGRAGS